MSCNAGYRGYKLFQEIRDANSSFVARLQNNVAYDIIEQRPLTDDDKKAGVQRNDEELAQHIQKLKA